MKKKSILLRIEKDLWKELQSWSEEEMRSLNTLLEFILKEAIIKQRDKDRECDE